MTAGDMAMFETLSGTASNFNPFFHISSTHPNDEVGMTIWIAISEGV
jgi:hypothetical protein